MDTNKQSINRTRGVNKLPYELLSRIFVLGEDMQRGPRMSGHPYAGLQDVVTQVCGHWRRVAINTPKLWTYIYIAHPPPHHHAQLYISRSGTCHLDIDIEMKTPYNNGINAFDLEQRVGRMLTTVRLIIEYGGTMARWRSLVVFADVPRVIPEMIACINAAATPALQFLLLRREQGYDHQGRRELDALEQARSYHHGQSLSHGSTRPQLRHVELHGLPNGFIFNRTAPIVSNLTGLKLTGDSIPLSVDALCILLGSNPRLESLSLEMGIHRFDDASAQITLPPSQLQLRFLRSLALSTSSCNWVLALLKNIDAPAVESFELQVSAPGDEGRDQVRVPFARYVGIGRVNGILQRDVVSTDESLNCGPIFPSLHHLNLGRMHILPGQNSWLHLLFQGFSSAERVSLTLSSLEALAEQPELLPNVSHVTYVGTIGPYFFDAMSSIASERASSGTPISFLQLSLDITNPQIVNPGFQKMGREVVDDFISSIRPLIDRLGVHRVEHGTEVDSAARYYNTDVEVEGNEREVDIYSAYRTHLT